MLNNKYYFSTLFSLFALVLCSLMMSCSRPAIPTDAVKEDKTPVIFPDYKDVTVPSNLCPTNFMLPDCDEVVAQLSSGSLSFVYGEDNKVIIDEDEWKELCTSAAGDSKGISVEVYGKKDGKWHAYKPFAIYVVKDSIDSYIAYRLIQPSYVNYKDLYIAQRDVTCYDESVIYYNELVAENGKRQCINCHSFQNNNTEKMLFHMRSHYPGTMIVTDGELKKVDLKTDSTISAGVYPSWHPKANLVAFSTNTTTQVFHSKTSAKIEVFDYESDLILYDVAKNEVSTICNDNHELESFPTWSPDGKTLYYTSAYVPFVDTIDIQSEMKNYFKEIKYNIYSRSFDINTRQFGEPKLVFDAASINKSATLPRVSPDGRYLTFALGNYGCFHVWHKDADICVIDLQNGQNSVVDTRIMNSNESDSYPSFSSNGRWIMTSSRRDDGNYTRPYIAYFDAKGKCHKAFAVPQKDPEANTLLLQSYNRPEFLTNKVSISPKQFAEKAREDALSAKYKTTKH